MPILPTCFRSLHRHKHCMEFPDGNTQKPARTQEFALQFTGRGHYYLGLCAIAKDEDRYLEEWICHHVLAGVEHFVIYDNASHPVIERKLAPFVAGGLVTVVHWPFPFAQMNTYQHCLDIFGPRFRWLGFCDLDEFLVPRSQDDLRAILLDYEDHPGLAVSSCLFGSSGHESTPDGFQIASYTQIVHHDSHVKAIVQPAHTAAPLSPHHFRYKDQGHCVSEDGYPVLGPYAPHTGQRIRLNHYYYRSREDWQRKVGRGVAHPLRDRDGYDPDIFEAQVNLPVTPDSLMAAWSERLAELVAQGPQAVLEHAQRIVELASEEHLELVQQAVCTVEAHMDSGAAPDAQHTDLFLLLACYLSNSAYVCTLLARYCRATGRPKAASRWLKHSLLLEQTPEAYLELALGQAQTGATEQAQRTREYLREQLTLCGGLHQEWEARLNSLV